MKSKGDVYLNQRQRKFCHAYVQSGNATHAAIEAGYKKSGAHVTGCKLLKLQHVNMCIEMLQDNMAQRNNVDADRIVQELCCIAFTNIDDVVDFGPGGVSIRRREDVRPEARAAIRQLKMQQTEDGQNVTVSMHDKLRSLEMLGKHLGMFTDRREHHFPDGVPISFIMPTAAAAGEEDREPEVR